MITRIELHNFMSHRKTVIEPSPGLTVLIGPNNCGKSAVVAALQILCHNENSTYVKRHGARECAVVVQTSEGHTIEWRRRNSPRYLINGVEHSRLGNAGIPAELHPLLRLPLVADEDDDSFNVHIGSQKSPVFLLNTRAGIAARFFASSSDAIRLLEMQQRHKEKAAEARRKHQELEAEAAIVAAELAALEPTVPLAIRVEDLERRFIELGRIEENIESIARCEAELADRHQRLQLYAAQEVAFRPLQPPPVLADAFPLEKSIERLSAASDQVNRLAAESACLAALPAFPEIADESTLDRLLAQLEMGTIRIDRLSTQRAALKSLPVPPGLEETLPLQALVRQLERARSDSVSSEARCERLRALNAPPLLSGDEELERQVRRLTEQNSAVQRLTEAAQVIVGIQPPPDLDDEALLEATLERLSSILARTDEAVQQVNSLEAEQAEAGRQLRDAVDGAICPTCGQRIDATQLMTHVGSSGGDAHGAA